MTIFGVDLHPKYQAGISLRRVRDEGFRFAIVKMSEATNAASYSGSRAWAAEARSLGMLVGGYHYLRAGNIAAQVDTFVAALEAAGNPAAMLDVEEGSGNIGGVLDFIGRCERRGHPIRMLYMPRWYWQQIGQPNLGGLPPLWSSRYASMTKAAASVLYSRTPSSYWGGYGNGRVAVLQFSSAALVASHVVDVNAFEGTEAQLAALFGGAAPAGPAPAPAPAPIIRRPSQEDQEMHVYSAEPAEGQAKKDWPRRTVTFGFDPAGPGRWGGNGVLHVHFGHRGGWIHRATWAIRDTNQWSPNTPVHYAQNHPVGPEGSDRPWAAPWIVAPWSDQADEIEIEFSAPDGMHVFMAYEK